MIIPNKIRIGSCDYDVDFTEDNIVVNGSHCKAAIAYDDHVISIGTKLGDAQQRELSFLHEMFHGIVNERSLEFEDEELVVEELAKGLHQVIRDNQGMFTNEPYPMNNEVNVYVQATE